MGRSVASCALMETDGESSRAMDPNGRLELLADAQEEECRFA